MAWLYRYEAKGIQSYILATERLREMKGASALVAGLEQLAVEALRGPSGELMMAAAGSATIRFERKEDLDAFASLWPMLVARRAPGLQLVQAWAEVVAGAKPESALAEVRRRLEAERNRPVVELPEAGPLLARAGRTGRPAVGRAGKDGSLQDASSREKEKARAAGPEELIAVPTGRDFVEDMEDFGEGYVAVLHADGNGVGARILGAISARDAAAQKRFSEALTESTRAAAEAAVRELDLVVGQEKHGKLLPIRPLVLGGDDFTVILKAEHAVAFAAFYLRAFERETEKRAEALGGKLTACAGIAMVKSGFPFHQAHALAEALCRQAKRGAGREVSSLSFHRVTTAAFDSLEDVLETELGIDDGGTCVKGALLGGPWTVTPGKAHPVETLAELAKALAKLPRGSVREWLRVVRFDLSRARAHWGRLAQNARENPKSAEHWEKGERRLGGLGADPGTALDSATKTPIYDAALLHGVGGSELWRDAR